MSYEVVYTSSPRGLKGGDRGFCTVAATSGTPRQLNEKLESLSGYRHAYAAASELNPVNYSYLIVQIQRERYYVLSRIADAGNDFSGRTNKIAHHLALSEADVQSANAPPDELLSDTEFWFKSWNGKPQELPSGRMPSPYETGADRCGTWEDVFGDAGWAGLLARAVRENVKPVWIIVPTGKENLALLSEAMQLVSPQDRWKVSFSTYYTRSAASSDCHWRFVLEGTDEARKLRARPSGLLVDPSNPKNALPDGDPFVEAARSGDASKVYAKAAPRRQMKTRRQQSTSNNPVTKSQIRRRQAAERARQKRLGEMKRPRSRPEPVRQPAAQPVAAAASGRGRRFWWILAAGVLIAGAAIFFLVRFVIWPSETSRLDGPAPSRHQIVQKNVFDCPPLSQADIFT